MSETWIKGGRKGHDGERWELNETHPTLNSFEGHNESRVVTLISSTGGSPVRTYRSPGRGPALTVSAVVSGLSSTGSCANCGHDGSLLRMSPDFYPATEEQTSPSSSPGWMNSGSMQRGRYWTRSTSESRNAADACSLSAVLEGEVPSKFYLSAKAAAGRSGCPL